jgi:hypothetical protein
MKQNNDSRFLPYLRFALAITALVLAGLLGRTALAASAPVGRTPLAQTECGGNCIVGTPTVQWSGSSGSFHVDRVENRGSSTSLPLALQVQLQSTYPNWEDFGAGEYELSDLVLIGSLPPGGSLSNIDSGTIGFDGSKVPAGEYWVLILLLQYPYKGWVMHDFAVANDKATCDGSSCKILQPGSCSPDAYTACLIGGRYKVTSHWQNQFAGGQVSTLSATRLTDATAAFWLTDPNTYEYLIRINTATDNGKAWIAIPTFTDVEFWIAVTDTVRGQYYEYHSPAGNRTLIYDSSFFVYP